MKIFFFLLIVLHGLIHLLGVAKASGIVEVKELTHPISKPAGVAWLVAALLLLTSALLFILGEGLWWIVGIPAVILSQTLIFQFWSDAKFGTIANVLILFPLTIAIANFLPGSYSRVFQEESNLGIARLLAPGPVTETDLAGLPFPVRKYLRYAGVVNKPRVQNFHAHLTGQMRREQGWMDISAEQYNFYDERTRAFFIQGSVFGVPLDGLHLYKDTSAIMHIRLASLFRIVNAEGDTMTKSETVTMFNDMCLLAPATLIDTSIRWEPIDSLTAKATFTNAGRTISALLYFNREGALVDFRSDNRFMSEDGLTYTSYPWSTPVRNYRNFAGRNVATEADVIWHMPDGDYTYGKFKLTDIQYNCSTLE